YLALGAGGPLALAPAGAGPAPLVGGLASPLWPSGVAGRDLRGASPFCRHGLPSRGLAAPGTDHRTDPAGSPANPAKPPQIGLGATVATPFSPIPNSPMNSPMNLLTYLLAATARWGFVFPQERSLRRAIALAFGILCGVGRRTV